MARALPEWIGLSDDSSVPPPVRLRVLERFGRRCGSQTPASPLARWRRRPPGLHVVLDQLLDIRGERPPIVLSRARCRGLERRIDPQVQRLGF
jgi:hypothetical protein